MTNTVESLPLQVPVQHRLNKFSTPVSWKKTEALACASCSAVLGKDKAWRNAKLIDEEAANDHQNVPHTFQQTQLNTEKKAWPLAMHKKITTCSLSPLHICIRPTWKPSWTEHPTLPNLWAPQLQNWAPCLAQVLPLPAPNSITHRLRMWPSPCSANRCSPQEMYFLLKGPR